MRTLFSVWALRQWFIVGLLVMLAPAAAISIQVAVQAKPPGSPEKRVTKQQGSPSTENPTTGEKNNSAPYNATLTLNQNGPTDAHASESQREEKENIKIQHRLAILTTWLVIAAFLTCLVIGWQAWETRKSANAGKKNIDLLIVTQRAQLVIAPIKPIYGVAANEVPRPQVHLINAGQTPAYNCIHETWIEVLPYPFTDFTSAAVYKKVEYPMTIYCNTPSPPLVEISLGRALTPKEATAIHAPLRAEEDTPFYLCFRIKIEYQDAFASLSHNPTRNRHTDSAFVFDGEGVGAFPKYNDSN